MAQNPMQFFNLWKHKFEVIYREIPLSIETIHDVYAYCAEMTAIVAVLAGMPADARQSIMNNCYDDTNSLISECSTTLSHSNISSLRSRPTHHYGNRQNTHYHDPRYQGNSQQHSHDTHYQNHHPRYPRFGNNHFRQSNSHGSPQHHQDQHQSQHRNYHQQTIIFNLINSRIIIPNLINNQISHIATIKHHLITDGPFCQQLPIISATSTAATTKATNTF